MMKNKNLWSSIKCAARGLNHALRTEKNFRYYAVIAAVFLILNLVLAVSPLELALLFWLCASVFAMECMNTAVERLVDSRFEQPDERARVIKDVSASAVLCLGIGFFTAEGIVLLSKLW
ncbi:MAG: diacylglycerol kinase [Acetatifactor muris]|nr:diacylglycerol kinase [Acetatifactor muris]